MFDDLWGAFTNLFSGSGNPGTIGSAGYPSGGWSGMTPDQAAMVSQQGWAPRPDMVMPTGSIPQQPTGYSGLSPAQAMTANPQTGLGYYSDPGTPGATGKNPYGPDEGGSLWDKLQKAVGSQGFKDLTKSAQDFGSAATPQPLPGRIPPAPASHPYFGGMAFSPYAYLRRFNSPLDPRTALAQLSGGRSSLYG